MSARERTNGAGPYVVRGAGVGGASYVMFYTSSEGRTLMRMTGDVSEAHRFPSKNAAREYAQPHGLTIVLAPTLATR